MKTAHLDESDFLHITGRKKKMRVKAVSHTLWLSQCKDSHVMKCSSRRWYPSIQKVLQPVIKLVVGLKVPSIYFVIGIYK